MSTEINFEIKNFIKETLLKLVEKDLKAVLDSQNNLMKILFIKKQRVNCDECSTCLFIIYYQKENSEICLDCFKKKDVPADYSLILTIDMNLIDRCFRQLTSFQVLKNPKQIYKNIPEILENDLEHFKFVWKSHFPVIVRKVKTQKDWVDFY